MTDATVLRALRDRVAAGKYWSDLPRPSYLHTDLCWKAFNGSLDAAKALHEALLTGWGWNASQVGASVSSPTANIAEGAAVEFYRDGSPARAWLLAILDAKIWEIENDGQ